MRLPTKTLSELTIEIRRGISSYYFSDEGIKIPLINIGALQNGQIVSDSIDGVTVKQTEAIKKSTIAAGDVLIGIKGSFKAAVADEKTQGSVISANVIALKLNAAIMPNLLVAYLNSPSGQRKLCARAGGAIQKALNLKALLEIPIPVPSIERQRELTEYLSLLKKYTELIEREQRLREKVTNTIIHECMGVSN